MRISDWSSDVCSSDLHDGHTDIDDPEAIELQRLACVHSPRLPHRNNPTKAPFGAFFMPGEYMADIFDWSSSASSNTTVDGININTGCPAGNVDNAIRSVMALIRGSFASTLKTFFNGSAPRSEEHTSELQSLMRNSYAVFCLKK